MSEPAAPFLEGDNENDIRAALQQLAYDRRKRRIPFIQQLESADCGAACLAMVVNYFGNAVTLDDVRGKFVTSARDGSDGASIAAAGEAFGLRARGITLDVEHLQYLPQGSILHWNFNHFVVFDRFTKDGVELVDPALGRRVVPMPQVRVSLTGVAIVFEISDKFEAKEQNASRIAWFAHQLRGQGPLLARILTTSVLLRVVGLVLPLLTGTIIDRVIPRSDISLLWLVLAAVVLVALFNSVSGLVRAHLMMQMRTNLDTKLTFGFMDYITRLPYDFFQRRPVGDLQMRVNSNAQLREILTGTTLSSILDGILVIGYAAVIFTISPTMGFAALIIAAVQVSAFVLSRRRMREINVQAIEASSKTQSYLIELLSGMSTLKIAAAERRAAERWSNMYVNELNVNLDRGRLQANVDAFSGAISGSVNIIMLMIGATLVLEGDMSIGSMISTTAIALGMLGPITGLVGTFFQLQQLDTYLDRIDDVLRSPPEQNKEEVTAAPTLRGKITLEHISFRYSPASPMVVTDVNLEIEAGAMVAIVGASGSGKSTLASIIGSLYKPTTGYVYFDGNDAAKLDLRSVRRQLGVVLQDSFLFATSVRDNIALTNPTASLETIAMAAKMACIHDDILAMPMGYDTVLADRGSSMSGGQRQRISLARALVHRPGILILDEATSALDARTELQVIENLGKLQCTRIVLAHRLSTVKNADLILLMDGGYVLERGTHEELLAKRGKYYELVQAQIQMMPGAPTP
ncbi:MAG: peptidase domain-containing ABC transporter [Myxococcales bacterium]|nr:peptidase domain-containing ABC transporter [Myxococcales bacterium]